MEPPKQEAVFSEGLFFDRPRDGAPSYVKGRLSISARKFFTWMKANPQYLSDKGWLNLDLKTSKEGKLYLQVNTYKPKKVETTPDSMTSEGYDGEPAINADEIPW